MRGDVCICTCYVLFYCANREIFCDFGKDFVVVDNDGETPVSCMISAITQVGDHSLEYLIVSHVLHVY